MTFWNKMHSRIWCLTQLSFMLRRQTIIALVFHSSKNFQKENHSSSCSHIPHTFSSQSSTVHDAFISTWPAPCLAKVLPRLHPAWTAPKESKQGFRRFTLVLDLLYLTNTTTYTQAGKESGCKWYEPVSRNMEAVTFLRGENAVRAAGVSLGSSSLTSLISPLCVLPHVPPNTAAGDKKNERSGSKCNSQTRDF